MSAIGHLDAVGAVAALIVQLTDWPADAVGADFEFLHTGVLDSLGIVQLIGAVEDELGVALGPDDLRDARFSTVGGLAAIVSERRAR